MKIDLRQGYNNVQIKKGNKWKMVLTTLERSLEPMVMFFGLTNLSITFQTIMNEILWNLINTRKVMSFIDDVIVGTKIEERHDKLIEEVVRRLAENDLYIKLEKYKQKVRKVGFLRVVIEPEKIKIEEEKMKNVLDWLTPKGVADIQKFLGLANYYHQFIKDFTVIARPLHNIMKKDQKWKWTERQEEVFRKLKKRFTKELVLVAPYLDKKMRMEVDVLDYATEEILFIKCENKRWQPVTFLSKSLNEIERNYEIHDKEILVGQKIRDIYQRVQSSSSRSRLTIRIWNIS